ncbi:three-Cys-motif partner protein TcmP [Halococcus sp. IIIV-5B]|uniref:three-Cys-motif partner protein TcmP n=1 Tax=Halococcus sp. IIIV-5B TaxID=2321230 RepID=UPI000E70D858|nr:three-Cys-motif partner protein TcmP [Halococcus sp. IIIV-5B]RJT04375.1 three-Cys-motif partner protein TcmP [Halococcus sp. IIIV-5B]
MTLSDDDDKKWTYHKHTRAKHDVLKYYSDVWTRIVSDDNRNLRLFDCFAGRGDYVRSDGVEPIDLDEIESAAEYPGSPQILLDQATKHSHLFNQLNCYFFEPKQVNREQLRDNIDDLTGVANNVSSHIVGDEFAEGISDVLRRSGGPNGFAFFFLDPFGLKQIPFNKVSEITSISQFDCLINLMTNELVRWQDSDKHNDTIESLYGTSVWRRELQSLTPKDLSTAEAEYYCNRLENHNTDYTLAYMTTEGDNSRLKYHLVFTTNSDKGLTAMRDSMMRCGTNYTLAYAPEDPDFTPQEQATLVGGNMLTEEDRVKSYLLTRFAGQEISFDELVTQCYIDRRYEDSLRQHYRQYLKEMDNGSVVNIPNREAENDPLPEDYLIQFPNVEEEESANSA